jgi:predicted ester cyclase
MSDIEKMAMIAALYDEWNAGNLERVYALLAPKAGLSAAHAAQLTAFRRTLLLLKTAMPDLELAQTKSVVDGETLRDVVAGTGTFTRQILGVAPTRLPIFFTATTEWHFENGQPVPTAFADMIVMLNELLEQGTAVDSSRGAL